jgi:hypothetical protein
MRYRQPQSDASKNSRFFKVALVLVRLDHVASIVVNANYGTM